MDALDNVLRFTKLIQGSTKIIDIIVLIIDLFKVRRCLIIVHKSLSKFWYILLNMISGWCEYNRNIPEPSKSRRTQYSRSYKWSRISWKLRFFQNEKIWQRHWRRKHFISSVQRLIEKWFYWNYRSFIRSCTK